MSNFLRDFQKDADIKTYVKKFKYYDVFKKQGGGILEEKPIGKITHYYNKIGVAVVELKDKLKVGDEIHIKGTSTDFKQKVESIQVEHENIKEAKKGDSIGLKVTEPIKEHDIVYRLG